MRREHDPEITECRNCESQFDLAHQHYYDDLCPTCKREQDGDDAVDRFVGTCYVCNCDVLSNEQVWSKKAAPYDVRGPVLVCPDHSDHTFSPGRGV